MLHTNLICLGKLKENYWRQAEAEYLKRLGAFAKIKIIELKEESFGDKDNVDMIKLKESEKIFSALPENSFVIVLDSTGQQFTSKKLSQQLTNNLTIQQFPAQGGSAFDGNNLTFIIGGPLGLHESILKIAQLKLSLSTLTFTHQMARVILWEQLYRAFMIASGRKYHY